MVWIVGCHGGIPSDPEGSSGALTHECLTAVGIVAIAESRLGLLLTTRTGTQGRREDRWPHFQQVVSAISRRCYRERTKERERRKTWIQDRR